MKTILITTIILIFAATLAAQSKVSGRVYEVNPSGVKTPLRLAVITLYDENGQAIAYTRTSSFGYYELEAPCCSYFVLAVSDRLHYFEIPAVIFNTAFDDGNGFRFNFVGYRYNSPPPFTPLTRLRDMLDHLSTNE